MSEPTKPAGAGRRTAAAAAIAVALAIPAEGIKLTPYYDPPGIMTVCRGHTGNVQQRRYTLAECDALMDADMRVAVATVERCVPGLPERVLASFADAVFNLGGAVVCDPKRSTIAKLLREGRTEDACRELPRWTKARVAGVLVDLPGLVKRRDAEMKLCLSGLEKPIASYTPAQSLLNGLPTDTCDGGDLTDGKNPARGLYSNVVRPVNALGGHVNPATVFWTVASVVVEPI